MSITEPGRPKGGGAGSRLAFPPALRYPKYRAYWLGMLAAVSGFQALVFSVFWLAHELTGSPLYLGYVGVASALPAIALNLVGGVVADKLDKKRLIVVTQTLSSLMVFSLAGFTQAGLVRPWHVLAISALVGAVNAFNQPARLALYPHLLSREALVSAVALNASVWQGTRIVAPAIAGVLIAAFGTAAALFFSGACMLVFAVVIARLQVPPIPTSSEGSAVHNLLEGLRFIKGNTLFSFLIAMTFFSTFFGMTYMPLMPIFARDILRVGADGQGVLLSLNGIGQLVVTLWLGMTGGFRRRGFAVIGGATMTGLAVAAFALCAEYLRSYVLAGFLMLAVGVFTATYLVTIMSSVQIMVPDRMRGRVMGFYSMTWNMLPLGGMYAGALAVFVGTSMAVALGGLLVTAFALGPALLNSRIRNLGKLLGQEETALAEEKK